jgi:hypothetical protein
MDDVPWRLLYGYIHTRSVLLLAPRRQALTPEMSTIANLKYEYETLKLSRPRWPLIHPRCYSLL